MLINPTSKSANFLALFSLIFIPFSTAIQYPTILGPYDIILQFTRDIHQDFSPVRGDNFLEREDNFLKRGDIIRLTLDLDHSGGQYLYAKQILARRPVLMGKVRFLYGMNTAKCVFLWPGQEVVDHEDSLQLEEDEVVLGTSAPATADAIIRVWGSEGNSAEIKRIFCWTDLRYVYSRLS